MKHEFIYLEVNRIKGLFNFKLFFFFMSIPKGGEKQNSLLCVQLPQFLYVALEVPIWNKFIRKKKIINIYVVYNY